MTAVDQIRERWPLRAMAARLGLQLPERDGVKFRHPIRPDNTPSCTIKGEYLYDWSQGDGKPLDSIGLFAMAKGFDNRSAIAELAAELSPDPSTIVDKPKPQQRPAVPAKPPFQKLQTPSTDDLTTLAALRAISPSALDRSAALGHLFFADTREGRAYVVTDSARRACQSRRLDGKAWESINSKAWTSIKAAGDAAWPLGANDIGDRQRVILCEGGPDWLVAHEAEPDMAVCAMLGAKQNIHPEALQHFAGKSVRILAHGDDAGADACRRWAMHLTAAGATVTAVRLIYDDARDLNDCTRLPLARWKHFQLSNLLT